MIAQNSMLSTVYKDVDPPLKYMFVCCVMSTVALTPCEVFHINITTLSK